MGLFPTHSIFVAESIFTTFQEMKYQSISSYSFCFTIIVKKFRKRGRWIANVLHRLRAQLLFRHSESPVTMDKRHCIMWLYRSFLFSGMGREGEAKDLFLAHRTAVLRQSLFLHLFTKLPVLTASIRICEAIDIYVTVPSFCYRSCLRSILHSEIFCRMCVLISTHFSNLFF